MPLKQPEAVRADVAVVGLGNMGVSVLGACLEKGLRAVAIDVNAAKTGELEAGRTVVPESGAERILQRALAEGRLTVATSIDAVATVPLVFIGVQTPARGTSCDYTVLKAVLRDLAAHAPHGQVIVVGSTVFPGAIARELLPLLVDQGRPDLEFVYEPVFLRAGFGIADYQRPGKLVLGVRQPERPHPSLDRFVRQVVEIAPRYVGYAEAEWIKMVHNAWMCVKIAFTNEVAALAAEQGASPAAVLDIAFSESAYGRLLTTSHMTPGPPYSGPCLPKDAQILGGLVEASRHRDWLEAGVCRALRVSNEQNRRALVDRWLHLGLGSERPLGIIGVAFRPEFNEMRESLALDFFRAAERASARVLAYDPMFEGVDEAAFRLAARGDGYVEGLHGLVGHSLEEVWTSCGVVLLNRRLTDVERARVARLGAAPRFVIDLYANAGVVRVEAAA